MALLVVVYRAAAAGAEPPPGAASVADGEAAGGSAAGETADVARAREPDQRSGWVLLPGVTYTPDHGFNVSGSALRYFHTPSSARASRAVLTVEGATTGRGMVTFDPDVWLDGDRFHLGGTAWVSYLDYAYFGIGNDTRMADREDFTATRWTVRPEAVARIARSLYGGAVYEFRYEDMVEVEEGGELDTGEVTGRNGGAVSGLGALLRWDSRDHSFTPRSGGLVEVSPRIYRAELGGDFDFTRLLAEASWFFGLSGPHVLAVNGRIDLRGGDPPFSYLVGGGGSRLLRGMLEGRYHDRHFIGAQVEYRYPLWWRFGGVAFAGLGRVAGELDELGPSGVRGAAGGGLRFAIQKDERITVRLDYGKSRDDSGFYFAMLEAF
jgi:hypothetical protein